VRNYFVKMSKSTNYIMNAPWSELTHRMTQVRQKEKTIDLDHPEAFKNIKPCKVSHVRCDSRGNKQIAFSYKSTKIHIMTHVLSFIVHNRVKINCKDKLQVSHLCNHHWCHEPEHLILEDSKQNQNRKNCVGKVYSDKYSDWIEVCDHIPPCLTSRKLTKTLMLTVGSPKHSVVS